MPASWAKALPSGHGVSPGQALASRVVGGAAEPSGAGAGAAKPDGRTVHGAAGSCACSTANCCSASDDCVPELPYPCPGPNPVPRKRCALLASDAARHAAGVGPTGSADADQAGGGVSIVALPIARQLSTARLVAWCTSRESRKRTSILVGCTLTSTRSGAISMCST